jgi:hypothetical protein
MTRRKGGITRGDLKRKWPHHAALPSEKVRGTVNSGVIFCAAGDAADILADDDSDFVVFWFSKAEDDLATHF